MTDEEIKRYCVVYTLLYGVSPNNADEDPNFPPDAFHAWLNICFQYSNLANYDQIRAAFIAKWVCDND